MGELIAEVDHPIYKELMVIASRINEIEKEFAEAGRPMYTELMIVSSRKMEMDEEAQKRRSVVKHYLHRVFRLACILVMIIIPVVIGFGYSLVYLLLTNNQRSEKERIVNALYELLCVTFLGSLFLTLGLLTVAVFNLTRMMEIETDIPVKEIVRRFILIWFFTMTSYVVVIVIVSFIGFLNLRR